MWRATQAVLASLSAMRSAAKAVSASRSASAAVLPRLLALVFAAWAVASLVAPATRRGSKAVVRVQVWVFPAAEWQWRLASALVLAQVSRCLALYL